MRTFTAVQLAEANVEGHHNYKADNGTSWRQLTITATHKPTEAVCCSIHKCQTPSKTQTDNRTNGQTDRHQESNSVHLRLEE